MRDKRFDHFHIFFEEHVAYEGEVLAMPELPELQVCDFSLELTGGQSDGVDGEVVEFEVRFEVVTDEVIAAEVVV